MKHLSTFESFSINEEGIFSKAKKWATGHEDSTERFGTMKSFLSDLKNFEEEANNDDNIVFNKAKLEKDAKENNYLGKLDKRVGGASNKEYVIYVPGRSGLQTVAGAAANRRDNPLG